jgi:hypothetical protein
VIVPEVPVIVRERAYGVALVVVFIVRVDEPLPEIEGGLKPPLVIPAGKPDSLPTLRLTGPVNPLSGVTVTLNEVDWPGSTVFAEGLTEMSKLALAGRTLIVRVGGFGSELPMASTTVSDVTYSPGVLKVTFPGFCDVEVAGDPPGNTHEYFAALDVVPKDTDPPAPIVMSKEGVEMTPLGGAAAKGEI